MPTQDSNTLDILGNLHYVMAILTAVFSCIPIIHFVVGIAILGSGLNGGDAASRVVGILFVIISAIIIIAGWAFAVLILIAGSRLKQRISYNFCLVIAFLECLIVPLGTVLGIFTILNLTKDPVKDLFE